MKRFITLLLALSVALGLTACGRDGGGGGGEKVTDLVVLSAKNPVLWLEDEEPYILEVDYPAGYGLKIKPGDKNIASLEAVQNSNNRKYKIIPKREGEYVVQLLKGEEVKETVTVSIYAKYPSDPGFNPLQMRPNDYTSWTEFGAHDPSIIEADGKYYAFSTDVTGTRPGYQIRESSDLTHWKYIQSAFSADDLRAADYLNGVGEFQEAFNWCKTAPDAGGSTYKGNDIVTNVSGAFSFWAPDVILGTDGKYWLYYSLTGFFGGSKSCIGLAKADSVTGPYKHDSVIVKSPEGWTTPNCIDAQVIYEENDPAKGMHLIYGSFGKGIFTIELDPATGRRKENVEYTGKYNLAGRKDAYYGTRIAGESGGMEGPVVTYQKDVPVYNASTNSYENKSFYYLFTSYGDLTSTYHMRCARSETVDGVYTDVNGKELKADTRNWGNSTGNKVMGSFQWSGYDVDFNAPGHNDLYTLANGVNLVAYHCRTYYFQTVGQGSGNNFHYLYLSQYAFNEDGQIVVNPNRYAGERLRAVERAELITANAGKYKAVLMKNESTANQVSVNVRLTADGKVTGEMTGTWDFKGDNYVNLTLDGMLYKGVAMPAWLQEEGRSGITVTALSPTGMALYLNMDF